MSKDRVLQGVLALTCLVGVSAPAFAQPARAKVTPISVREIDPQAAKSVSYFKDVRPVLERHCVECHSSDERKAEFEVSSVETLLTKGRRFGPGVVPFRPDESAVVQRIKGDIAPQMPKDGKPLTEDELHVIRQWIAAGAKDDSPDVPEALNTPAIKPAYEVVTDELARIVLDPKRFEAVEDKPALLKQWRDSRIAKLPPPPAPPAENADLPNPIDRFVIRGWGKMYPPPARPTSLCDDSTFLRRAYLDVVGVIPTMEQAERFLANTSPDKREKLIDDLLSRNAEYAAHWTPFWEDALLSGLSTGGLRGRVSYRDWVFKSFSENKPYDLFVLELFNLSKKNPAQRKKDEPPRDYILTKNHEETLVSVSNASQVLLGTSMKCASCHNHFDNKEWPQKRFLSFAGLFVERDLEVIRCEKKSGRYAPAEFPFEIPGLPTTTSVGREQLMAISIIDPLNPRFAKAIVNRLWKRYVGLGLIEPVDDFREDVPPANPELLDWLAQDFIRHGYDLKHTVRTILTSRTYQQKYDPALEDHYDVNKPTLARLYRSPTLRRTTAEQFFDSARVAVNQNLDPKKRLFLDATSTALSRSLGRPAARTEVTTVRPDDVAVVQELELMNGREIHQLVYSGKLLKDLAAEKDPDQIVRKLYLAVLSREPLASEKQIASEFLGSGTVTAETVGDLAWSLITGPEFQYVR